MISWSVGSSTHRIAYITYMGGVAHASTCDTWIRTDRCPHHRHGSPVTHAGRRRSSSSFMCQFFPPHMASGIAVLVLGTVHMWHIFQKSLPHRKSIENLSKIYRTSIENLSKIYRKNTKKASIPSQMEWNWEFLIWIDRSLQYLPFGMHERAWEAEIRG